MPSRPAGAGGLASLVGAGCAAALGLGAVVWATGASSPGIATVASSPLFFLGLTGAFAASLYAAWLVETAPGVAGGAGFMVVLAGALILRCLALPADPALSDDIYRYLWDGHVQSRGLNPYASAPTDPALDGIATDYRGLINNPELRTIYPPVSQMVFLGAAALGGGMLGMKILLVLFDLVTILALVALLKRRGMAPARVVIYAWSPLAVIEVAWSGHQDSIGVCLLTLALLAVVRGRSAPAVIAATLSGAAKYAGWLALAALSTRIQRRALAAIPLVAALCYLPYLGAGAGVLGSLLVYAEHWRFNDSVFALLVRGVESLRLSEGLRSAIGTAGLVGPLPEPTTDLARWTAALTLAKAIAAALFVAIAWRILRRRLEDPAREILGLLGAALVLSPTLHPWYLLWIAPLLALVPRISWCWLTWAAPLFGYPLMAMKLAGAEPPGWLPWAEYAPFYVMLGVEAARLRLWERGGGWEAV